MKNYWKSLRFIWMWNDWSFGHLNVNQYSHWWFCIGPLNIRRVRQLLK